jgi:hypothetical protein
MSMSGQWGGELEMALLSKRLKCIFLIYLTDGKVLTVSQSKSNNKNRLTVFGMMIQQLIVKEPESYTCHTIISLTTTV